MFLCNLQIFIALFTAKGSLKPDSYHEYKYKRLKMRQFILEI